MRRAQYILSLPDDVTVIRRNLIEVSKESLPPQEHPAGDNYRPEPYQLDPNDDDMSRLATGEYKLTQEEQIEILERDLPRELDWQSYMLEQDYYSNLEYERERGDADMRYADRYTWDQFDY